MAQDVQGCLLVSGEKLWWNDEAAARHRLNLFHVLGKDTRDSVCECSVTPL